MTLEFFHLRLPKKLLGRPSFDVAALEAQLAAAMPLFSHPHPPLTNGRMFIVCANEEMKSWLQPAAQSDPNAIGYQGFITLRPSHLTLDVNTTREILNLMSAFFLPFIRQNRCEILDEEGRNVTQTFASQLEKLF